MAQLDDLLEAGVASNNNPDKEIEFSMLRRSLEESLMFLGDQSAFDQNEWWLVDDYYGFNNISLYFGKKFAGRFEEIKQKIRDCLIQFPVWTVSVQFYEKSKVTIDVQVLTITTTALTISFDERQ